MSKNKELNEEKLKEEKLKVKDQLKISKLKKKEELAKLKEDIFNSKTRIIEVRKRAKEEIRLAKIQEKKLSKKNKKNNIKELPLTNVIKESSKKDKVNKKNIKIKEVNSDENNSYKFIEKVYIKLNKNNKIEFEKITNTSTQLLNIKKIKPQYEKIVNQYNELLSQEEPIHLKKIMKYVAYEHDIEISDDEITKIIMEIYIAIKRKIPVQIGNKFIVLNKISKFEMQSSIGIQKSYSSLRHSDFLKEVNQFVISKLKNGDSIKLFNGLVVTNKGDKVFFGANLI